MPCQTFVRVAVVTLPARHAVSSQVDSGYCRDIRGEVCKYIMHRDIDEGHAYKEMYIVPLK